MAEQHIFVSYSRDDAPLVRPVVQLLRVAPTFVFLDSDSIKPGEQWRTALAQAIKSANLVVVFWCLHSQQSSEIEKEYRAAIDAAKDIVPVLLDSTPVPTALGEYQWIDFRDVVGTSHGRKAPLPVKARRVSWYDLAAWAVPGPALLAAALWRSWLFALIAFGSLAVLLLRAGIYSRAGVPPAPSAPPSLPHSPYNAMARDLMAEIMRRSEYQGPNPFDIR